MVVADLAPGRLFDLTGRVAVVTGGSGEIGRAVALGLGAAGARVAILARSPEGIDKAVSDLRDAGIEAVGVAADVGDPGALAAAARDVGERLGPCDVLINAAGGNVPRATLAPGDDVFDLPADALRDVFELNFMGTLLPIQAFGRARLAAGPMGSWAVVNVSSMAAQRAITRVIGYSAAKAAVENLTRWLAVDLARRYGDRVRVNAVAPGFFIGNQNRALLLDRGELTERGRTIVDHTPAGRFGETSEVAGAVTWLAGDGASFVTGTVVAVDGGFSAFSGV
jgi:NAD(P)-dependent dehydrogenase (short-subunit alcohol dehydrogenase family)